MHATKMKELINAKETKGKFCANKPIIPLNWSRKERTLTSGDFDNNYQADSICRLELSYTSAPTQRFTNQITKRY